MSIFTLSRIRSIEQVKKPTSRVLYVYICFEVPWVSWQQTHTALQFFITKKLVLSAIWGKKPRKLQRISQNRPYELMLIKFCVASKEQIKTYWSPSLQKYRFLSYRYKPQIFTTGSIKDLLSKNPRTIKTRYKTETVINPVLHVYYDKECKSHTSRM